MVIERPPDESCVTGHRLKWGLLPNQIVGTIAQHVREREGMKYRMTG